MFIVQCVILNIISKISHNVDGVVGLQNCVDILKSEPGPSTGKCHISSDDRKQVVDKNIEEVTDMKVEQDPGPATSTGINSELAVSCNVCVYQGLCALDH
jgi:hypothetical protein